MELRDDYKTTTLRILGQFQLLEFALKLYIGLSYDLIHQKVGEALHFGYSIKDVETYSLERLLAIFSKLNGNLELQKQLNALPAKRNHIAHESLLVIMGESYDPQAVEKADEGFFHLEDDLAECLQLTIGELRSLRGKGSHAVA